MESEWVRRAVDPEASSMPPQHFDIAHHCRLHHAVIEEVLLGLPVDELANFLCRVEDVLYIRSCSMSMAIHSGAASASTLSRNRGWSSSGSLMSIEMPI